MTKIYVEFSDSIRAVPTVWTYNQFEDAHLLPTGQVSADLKDDTNTATGVSLHIDTAFSTSGGGGTFATADAGEFGEVVLDSALQSANSSASTLRIAGLPSGASYTLQLAGHTSDPDRDTLYTVEGATGEYLIGTAGAPTAPTEFTGTVDPDGELIINVEKTAGGEFYGYLNGFILEYTESGGGTTTVTQDVTIPNDIDLQWEQQYDLDVTDENGTYTLSNVTLSTPTGWTLLPLASLNPNAGDTEDADVRTIEFYSRTDTGLGGGGYTPIVGDELAFTTQAGLTINGDTSFVVDPAADVTFTYKWWDSTLNTWTAESTCTIDDLGVFAPVEDLVAPVISLTGASTIELTVGDTYTEQGATWTDNVDGSGAATVGGDTVDTNTVGTYTVTYNHTDAAGNAATQVARTVTVAALVYSITSINGNNTIEEGDSRVNILTSQINPASVTQSVLLNGVPLTITDWSGAEDAVIEIDVPNPINLPTGIYNLVVIHDGGTTALSGVTLTSSYVAPVSLDDRLKVVKRVKKDTILTITKSIIKTIH